MFDKWGLAEQLFQGGAFFFREPLIFELERLAEYLCKLLHPVPRRLHSLLDFPPSLWPGRELRKYHCLEVPEGCLFNFQGSLHSFGLVLNLGRGPCCGYSVPENWTLQQELVVPVLAFWPVLVVPVYYSESYLGRLSQQLKHLLDMLLHFF